MNIYYIAGFPVTDELYHHGIKGQKWGIRRYQNEDGTLTPAGKARYGVEKVSSFGKNVANKTKQTMASAGQTIKEKASAIDKQKLKKAAIIGGSVAAAALLAYGGYKLSQANIKMPEITTQTWDPSPNDDPFQSYAKKGFRALEERYNDTVKNTTIESIRTKTSDGPFGNITKSSLASIESKYTNRSSNIEEWGKRNSEMVSEIHKRGSDKVNQAYEAYKNMEKNMKKNKAS